jgi:hypothetical protein
MTDPDREHTTEPAEGADPPGSASTGGRTPHPEDPAEGGEIEGGESEGGETGTPAT